MPSAIVRFRPTGPWRFGPDSGTRDRVDPIFHSDSLYAAVSGAMLRLNLLEEWLDATARRTDTEPDVRFSSLFPFQRDILFVTPPRSLWPPPPSTKIRFKSARFVPLSVVRSLVAEQPIDENRWVIDAESECMIPSGEGPFRIGLRSAAAVDRLNPGATSPHITACIEFGRDAGLWTMVVFASDEAQSRWRNRVRSALRLLADTGFGGERSRGWGRSAEPEWQRCPDFWAAPESDRGYWLLSVYASAQSDSIDWKTGNYSTVTRRGRVESAANWGVLKAPTVMITEGSVLVAPEPPRGGAPNVAPPDFGHPVYRSGFAVSIPIPWKPPGTATPIFSAQKPVETAARPQQREPVVPVPPLPEPPPAEPEPAVTPGETTTTAPVETGAVAPTLEPGAPEAAETPATGAPESEVAVSEEPVVSPKTVVVPPAPPATGAHESEAARQEEPVASPEPAAPETAGAPESEAAGREEPVVAPEPAVVPPAPPATGAHESEAAGQEEPVASPEPEGAPATGSPESEATASEEPTAQEPARAESGEPASEQVTAAPEPEPTPLVEPERAVRVEPSVTPEEAGPEQAVGEPEPAEPSSPERTEEEPEGGAPGEPLSGGESKPEPGPGEDSSPKKNGGEQ